MFQAHEWAFESVFLWNVEPFKVRGHGVPLASLVPIPPPGAEWPFHVCRMNDEQLDGPHVSPAFLFGPQRPCENFVKKGIII